MGNRLGTPGAVGFWKKIFFFSSSYFLSLYEIANPLPLLRCSLQARLVQIMLTPLSWVPWRAPVMAKLSDGLSSGPLVVRCLCRSDVHAKLCVNMVFVEESTDYQVR